LRLKKSQAKEHILSVLRDLRGEYSFKKVEKVKGVRQENHGRSLSSAHILAAKAPARQSEAG
jgi:hypothetical protein